MEADTDRDGKISFEEFTKMVENTDVSMSMTLGTLSSVPVQPLDLLLASTFRFRKHEAQTLTWPQINSS